MTRSSFLAFAPAALLLAASLLGGVAVASAPAEDAAVVAVLFAPWSEPRQQLEQVAAAGGMPVRAGAVPFLWVVRSDRPGFPDRLRAAGVPLLLDPVAAWGCAPVGDQET